MEKLIKIIKSVLDDSQSKFEITKEDIKKAQYHKIEPFLYLACDLDKTSDAVIGQIKLLWMKDIKKDTVQLAELDKILSIFEENKIACLPLKGSIMKHFYPYSFLRFMGDIDILLHPKDIKKDKKLLDKKGYTFESNSYNHLALKKKPYLEVELHRDLLPFQYPGYEIFQNVWQRLHLMKNKNYIYQMTSEDFFLFMLLHLNKHYVKAGSGIRSFLDIYLYLQNNPKLDLKYVYQELAKVNLKEICEQYIIFSQKLFNLETLEGEYLVMAERVKNSGVFGSSQVRLDTELKENRNPIKTIWKKIFPSKKNMIQQYPVLNRQIYLFPMMYGWRLLKAIFVTPISSFKKVWRIFKNSHKVKNTK